MEVKKSICRWCNSKCSVEVYLKDGKLEKVEENKDHPRAEDLQKIVRSCPRSQAAKEWFYHPGRLNYPLKRAGEKGENKWEQITWEQALNEIAERLSEIKQKYGAEAVTTSKGTGRTHDEFRRRFFNLFGSPNTISPDQICFGPAGITALAMFGYALSATNLAAPTANVNCLLVAGNNPNQSFRHNWFPILRQLKNGMKLIVIDPRHTPTAQRADIWLQVRPGTDYALYLAIINVIITQEIYDKEFVDKWCYGFDKLTKRASDYTPEKAAEITRVPAELIKEAAHMFATNKPAIQAVGMGIEQSPHNIETMITKFALSAITGNIDVQGGERLGLRNSRLRSELEIELNDILPPEQKIKQIGAEQFKLQSFYGIDPIMQNAVGKIGYQHICHAHGPTVYRAMITGEPYPVKALITQASNPMVTQPNTKLVYQALKELELYVVHDYWMTPSAQLADYVLPCATWMERPELYCAWDMASWISIVDAALDPFVEGHYDRKTDFELWRGLGMRLGQEKYWPWHNLKETFDYRLEPMGLTVDRIITEMGGMVPGEEQEKKYEKLGFGTFTGKVELTPVILEKLGYDPLPPYKEPPITPISNPKLAKEFPLILQTGARHLPFFHSEHRQVDPIRKKHPEPLIELNPETAAKYGINEGDWVWIETPNGRVKQKCKYFDGIDPSVVSAQHGWWFPEMPGEEPSLHGVWESNINVVTEDAPEYCNPINGGWPLKTLLCKVYKVVE
jgi:anaerobic selenocysteine-containing dehydrogenase